jgi:hypothetical protein
MHFLQNASISSNAGRVLPIMSYVQASWAQQRVSVTDVYTMRVSVYPKVRVTREYSWAVLTHFPSAVDYTERLLALLYHAVSNGQNQPSKPGGAAAASDCPLTLPVNR